jgi:hypothetical protein
MVDENYVYACGFNGTDIRYTGDNKPTLYIWSKDGTRVAKSVIENIKPNYSISQCEKVAADDNNVYMLFGGYLLTFDKAGNRVNTIQLLEQNLTGFSVSFSAFTDMKIDDKNIYLGNPGTMSPAEMQIWDKSTLTLKKWIKFYNSNDTYLPGFSSMTIDNNYIYVSMNAVPNSIYKNIDILDKNGSLVNAIDYGSCISMNVDDNYLYCGMVDPGNGGGIRIFDKVPVPDQWNGKNMVFDWYNVLPLTGYANHVLSDQNYVYTYSMAYYYTNSSYQNVTSVQVWKK